MNSIEIEKVLLALGFEEKPNSSKSKRLEHKLVDCPVYLKKPSGNTKVNYVTKEPLVVHDRYQQVLENIATVFEGIKPNLTNYYHATSLTAFEKRQHNGTEPIHFGIAVDFQGVESIIQFVSLVLNVKLLGIEKSDTFAYKKDIEAVRQSWVDVRVGQGTFRRKLIDMWGRCSVTNVSHNDFLIASHIKPWVKSNNSEKIDVFNGLLLMPNLDRAFDKGYVSFDSTGDILI